MGAGSTGWAWSITPVALIGTPAIIMLTHVPMSVALFSVFIQFGALLAVGIPALRAVKARPPGPMRVLILSWRDTRHPQGGGSEVFLEQVARRLVAAGREVTVFCSAHPNAPARDVVDGVRFVRRGGWFSVYIWAFVYHSFRRFGPHDVVIDVKNGIPFLAPFYCTRPVVCLIHHVHREQWGMNFSSGWARFGWWVESRLSMNVYRRGRHMTVSAATRQELVAMGIPVQQIDVVYNGADPTPLLPKAERPTLLSLGRLVPHKRVELLLDAAAKLLPDVPDLHVVVAGQCPWSGALQAHAERLGIGHAVTFAGWVDETEKQRLLNEAWVLGMPSVKEGWGLAVMEAAACGTPAVAFRVGGLAESIVDRETGLLADDQEEFVAHLRTVLTDRAVRERMGSQAARRAAAYSWRETAVRFDAVLCSVLAPHTVEDALGGRPVPVLEAVPVLEGVSARPVHVPGPPP